MINNDKMYTIIFCHMVILAIITHLQPNKLQPYNKSSKANFVINDDNMFLIHKNQEW